MGISRKRALLAAAIVAGGAILAFAVPAAMHRYAQREIDAVLARIAWQTTSMVRRGDVSFDPWTWTVGVSSIEVLGPGGVSAATIGRLTIARPDEDDRRMTAERMVLDDVRIRSASEQLFIPRAEIRGYSGPIRGLTATPGIGRNRRSQADLFERLSISRAVAPVATFSETKTGLKRTIRNIVVNDMRDGVIGTVTVDSVALEAPYLPPTQEGAPSSLLITTGAVRYDGFSVPTLWRFRDGEPEDRRETLLKSVSVSNVDVSLTMRPSGRLSGSIDRIEVGEIGLKPLAFDILDFDPIQTGMRYGSSATPQEIREQLAFGVALAHAASFESVVVRNARGQITSAGAPQSSMSLGSAEIGRYADARVESVKFNGTGVDLADGLRFRLGAARARGFDASGLTAYADRIARDEALMTTTPTAPDMLKLVPRLKTLDAEGLDLSNPDGSLKADRARIDANAPLDAAPVNLTFHLDNLDASPSAGSNAQKWIERMELEDVKGSAKFSLTLDPNANVLRLDWLDYRFEGLGAVKASGSLEEVDPVLLVSSGAEFVDRFSEIRLAPLKLTIEDAGATDVLLRRAAAKAGEPEEAFREAFARKLEETIPQLLGPPAVRAGEAAADFIRDPRVAEITLAPRRIDQTLLDLIRAVQLGPAGLAQVVDMQVLYKR